MQAYCVKCRRKVEIKNPKAIKMKNKRPHRVATPHIDNKTGCQSAGRFALCLTVD